jgi:hypothetical protein
MSSTIRIDSDVEDYIAQNGRFKESSNDVLRRLFGLSDLKREKQLAAGNRYFVFDKSGVSILRWMRNDGWSEAEARKVFDSFGQRIESKTIECQFQKSRKGPIARLTKEQANELRSRR